MDPLTAGILTILGKYAIDAGATLAKEAGPAAKETAAALFGKVMGYLRKDPAGKAIADGYENNPQGYEAPMQDQVNKAVETDPEFKESLAKLVEAYEKEAAAFQPGVSVKVGKGGAAAVGTGAKAAAERAVIVDGNVSGSISTGDQVADREKT
jgi:hypothetical protein